MAFRLPFRLPRLSRRTRPAPLYAHPPRLRHFKAVGGWIAEHWPQLRLPLSLLAVAHLVGLVLLPGGQNALLEWRPGGPPAYLRLLGVDDALGMYKTAGADRFLYYKIYTQGGEAISGTFPDVGVSPLLRYDRWALAGHRAAAPLPEVHGAVARFVVGQLPSAPVRIELFSAHWAWDRNGLSTPWRFDAVKGRLELELLGTYNGLTQSWRATRAPIRGDRR